VNVLNDPGAMDALNNHGLTAAHRPRQLTAFLKKEDAKWGAAARERTITAN
jgi:hypothetical protein